ncbi:MAG: hypothetical protein HY704_08805 [Gemmatimonadetes bacterium]|nr:hypothetical protein [Gemmatimonadota bacterium]
MLRLQTFGTVALAGTDQPRARALVSQPKRLALLAYLAVGGAVTRRDPLLAMFWPELDELRARRALRQTLFFLRRLLEPDTIISMGHGGVAVASQRLWCDAVAFRAALAGSQADRALALYHGDFLAGLHLSGSLEFQRWVDDTRQSFCRDAVRAASLLVERAETAGDPQAARRYARRAVQLAPYDEAGWRRLIRLLDRDGDRAAAIVAHDELARRLSEDLELEPSPETRALIEEVRGRDAPLALPASAAETSPQTGIRTLAVLPLADLSGRADQLYFAEGMTDLLITRLAQIPGLSVISRTTAMQYRSAVKPIPQIARELNADAVVEGTVLRYGDRVRLTAQLIRAAPEGHLWADSFERDVGDVFALQGELARTIARQVQVVLKPETERRVLAGGAVPHAAQEAYLRGRYHWHRFTPEDCSRAIGEFHRAIELAPDFALAHAILAYVYANLGHWCALPPGVAFPAARQAAARALALDATVAEAYTAQAYSELVYDRDFAASEASFRRSIALSPSLSEPHWALAHTLIVLDRLDEAEAELGLAREVDPLSFGLNLAEGALALAHGKADAALERARSLLELDPGFANAHWLEGIAHELLGRKHEAVAALERAERLGRGAVFKGCLAHALAGAGRLDDARRLLRELVDPPASGYVPPVCVARVYARLGEIDSAFAWLERALEICDPWLVFLNMWPRLDPLREDPRFGTVLRRVGLPTT